MGNVGRFFCVALPFILTAASLVSLLIVGLAGVTNTNLYLFKVNTTNMSINRANIQNLLKISTRDVSSSTEFSWHDRRFLTEYRDIGTTEKAGVATGDSGSADFTKTDNITAADLGLDFVYEISLWGYCATNTAGNRNCTKPEWDWATKYLNTSGITTMGAAAGVNVTLPKEITGPLDAFKAVAKWTEVVTVIAVAALAIELLLGLFTSCSRIVSCLTWIVSGFATTLVIGAAAMMTAMSLLVVGAVEGTAKIYGVTGGINTTFLAVAWLAAAFALAAGLFWLFTICCCKPEHRSKSSRRGHGPESEKFIPSTGYAPLHDDSSRFSQQSYGAPRHQQSGPRSNAAYKPYSHSNV